MKIKCDNGNIVNRHVYMSHDSTDSANWTKVNKTNIENIKRDTIIGNLQYQNNSNKVTNKSAREILEIKYKEVNNGAGVLKQNLSNIKDDANVCNKQYRFNTQNINILTSCATPAQSNVEGDTKAYITSGENNIEDSNVSSNGTPVEEERAFDHSDSEEMFDNDSKPVPRGIVNPNYPGFQHLAHTLQDYSSNIENFYHSENDMTDDDVDLEIAESSYEQESNKNDLTSRNINNNDFAGNVINSASHSDLTQIYFTRSPSCHSEIPDLLRTVSKNNNNYNDKLDFDITCSDADIENNFHTKDIIGDFNKEIEDEIKQLFNYNINIQDDLKELRQDIQETFAKPIENTINNISEVVNHVIKKLVETQCDTCEYNASAREYNSEPYLISKEISDVNKDNEQNTKTEMNLSRPTFLLLECNSNTKIKDAFLSDGKDEININYPDDYNTEFLSNNVENTIKQLSTELRKIIPKLDQMREHDKLLWPHSDNTKKKPSITTDGNFNEVASSSQPTNIVNTRHSIEICQNIEHSKVSSIEEGSRLLQKCDPNNPKSAHQDVKPLNISCSQKDHTKPSVHNEKTPEECDLESFDVYNIETALPKLDIDAIENHLRAAKEAERRKRNDREEIRKRLAMGTDSEEYYSMGHLDRPGKKPSLQSRLQNGKNLQICFMNETASDNESQASDLDKSADYSSTKSLSRSSIFSKSNFSLNSNPYNSRPLSVSITKHDKISTVQSGSKLRPTSLSLKPSKSKSAHSLGPIEVKESDFYVLQATLQTEARIALAQAKEMARLQMECERRKRPVSPVTEMLQRSMSKASAPLAPDRRRVSRQLLTDMNIAQLQVIVNELHSQIEALNDTLVRLLMARDELHMGQDSMLVDIEDLTRYLGVKEQTKKTKGNPKSSGVRRLTSLVKK